MNGRMTVGELRHALSMLDDTLPVLVDGYEQGFDDPVLNTVAVAKVHPNEARAYYGAFDHAEGDTVGVPFVALVIGRPFGHA